MGQQDIWYEESLEFGDESSDILDFVVDLLRSGRLVKHAGYVTGATRGNKQGGWTFNT